MGFESRSSSLALILCNNDVNIAVQFLLNMKQQQTASQNTNESIECKNDVTKCKDITLLSKIMNIYNH